MVPIPTKELERWIELPKDKQYDERPRKQKILDNLKNHQFICTNCIMNLENMVGMRFPSVNQALRDLQTEGLIDVYRDWICSECKRKRRTAYSLKVS